MSERAMPYLALARTASEDDLLKAVLELAALYGWRTAHFRPALTPSGWRTAVQGDGAGFPDLVMVHTVKQRVLFIELKSERGKVSPEQENWGVALQYAGADYVLWRPSDLPKIAEVLR